jgi:hypothetical protein
VSWTVGGPFSLALHLKPVGAERPDWHAAELLITAFSLFYGAGDIFRATNLNALLKTTRWMPVRADQILKKTDATLDHGCNFPRGFMAAAHCRFSDGSRALPAEIAATMAAQRAAAGGFWFDGIKRIGRDPSPLHLSWAASPLIAALSASAIKNVSMTYGPRDMPLCLFLSRRGCSKLLTIDNKCGAPVLSLQPFPARSQEQHGRGAPLRCVQTDAIYFGAQWIIKTGQYRGGL